MLWLSLFVFGLIIGSFLNVIALRYAANQPLLAVKIIGGRSHCQTCQVGLRWYELVPVLSFLVQGARCRHCRHALNWQYPIVELATALITSSLPLLLYTTLGAQQVAARGGSLIWFYALAGLWLLASYTLITLAAIDLRLSIIPDQANILLITLGIAIAAINYLHFKSATPHFSGSYGVFLGGVGNPLMSGLVGALIGFLFFGAIIFFTKGRGMGLGDLKLAVPLGILLGWPDVALCFASAFIIGTIVAIPLLAQKTKTLKQAIPFGPFLVLGVFVAIFYGESILRWYFSIA